MEQSAVQQYNALHGRESSRDAINGIIAIASEQEQDFVVSSLTNVLRQHPGVENFRISIDKPAIEKMPASLLGCIDFENDTDDTIEGLGKAVSPDQIYKMITDRVVEAMDKVKKSDYVKGWKVGSGKSKAVSGYLIPYNFVSKKMYRGINRVMLIGFMPISNPFFLTFKQVTELGGFVRHGATGYPVIYFTRLYIFEKDNLKFSSYDKSKFIAWLEENRSKISLFKSGFSAAGIAEQSAMPIIKYYKVFNGADITGIDFDLENFKHGYVEAEKPAEDNNRIEVAEIIIENYPKPQPPVHFGGDKAAYYPGGDYIRMPKFLDFHTVQDYYRTLFHELAHSTGHGSRLNRELSMVRKKYAFEELIAEFAATFLSAEAGIIWHNNKNHTAYLKGWNEALAIAKTDTRFLMRAATQAQKAADFVLQYDKEGYPAYYRELKLKIGTDEKPKARTDKKSEVKDKAKPANPTAKRDRRKLSKSQQLSLALNGAKNTKKARASKKGLNGCDAPVPADEVVNNIPVNEPEHVTQPTPAPVKKNPLVMSSDELMSMEFESLKMDGPWANFMQEPAKNMKIAIWGKPKNGKTSGAAQLANYLTKFGNVLYNFVDQGFNKSTQDIWRNSGMEANPRAFATKADTIEDLKKLCALGSYQFVFVDMINDYIHKTRIKPDEFKEQFIKAFPNISFILVFEVTKSGNFKGDQGWTHIVDAICTVEDFLMENRGRYGVGHFVVWEEGFKKFNPKKYAEICEEIEPNAQEHTPKAETELKFTVI